jgi:hypothetical protein
MLLLLAIGAPAERNIAVGSYVYDERRLSLLEDYNDYKRKYLLSAMMRRDASTKFGPGNSRLFSCDCWLDHF